MNTHKRYIDRGFPGMITEMIAEASMELPPLDKPEDQMFIKLTAAMCIQSFWENYVSTCSLQAQQEFSAITEEKPEAFIEWMSRYAEFSTDQDAVSRADMVLEDMAIRLPQIMKDAYAEFHNAKA